MLACSSLSVSGEDGWKTQADLSPTFQLSPLTKSQDKAREAREPHFSIAPTDQEPGQG